MALIPCPECKKDMSTTAAACPACGARRPSASGKAIKVGLIVAVAVGLVIAGRWWIDESVRKTSERSWGPATTGTPR